MKNQALFSSKDKGKKIKMSSAAIFVRPFKGYAATETHTQQLSAKLLFPEITVKNSKIL